MHRCWVDRNSLTGLVLALFLPAAAAAQTGSIAGEVSDATGGVLPGVTVEADSEAGGQFDS